MSITELASKAQELKELQRMQEELTDAITAIQDAIKATMGDKEEIIAGAFKITWKPVTSSRLDTAALKKELPELAERFTKTAVTRRFVVA